MQGLVCSGPKCIHVIYLFFLDPNIQRGQWMAA